MNETEPPDRDKDWRKHDRRNIKFLDEARQHGTGADEHKRALYNKVMELQKEYAKK